MTLTTMQDVNAHLESAAAALTVKQVHELLKELSVCRAVLHHKKAHPYWYYRGVNDITAKSMEDKDWQPNPYNRDSEMVMKGEPE